MPNEMDRTGIFRVEILSYGLRDARDTQSLGITLNCRVLEMFAGDGQWDDWRNYDYECTGTIWFIGKDGKLDERKVQNLIRCTGWDGSLESVANCTWQPIPCQVTVESETYKNREQFRIGFVNAYDHTPGMVSTVAPEKARELQNRYGSQLRALVGNATRNQAPTPAAGKPSPPKRPGADTPAVAPSAREPAMASGNGNVPVQDEIPF